MSKRKRDDRECPEWCSKKNDGEYPCGGDHFTMTGGGHIPATAGNLAETVMQGAAMTTVSTGLSWAEAWGGAIGVWVNFYGDELDKSVTMTLGEAFLFHLAFADALTAAISSGVIPDAVWQGQDVKDALARLDAVRVAWVGDES